MKKILATLLVALMLIPLSATAASAKIVWISKAWSNQQVTIDAHHDIHVHIAHKFASGVRENGARVIKAPLKTKMGYETAEDYCGFGELEWVSFNSYFWGQDGRNVNPGEYRLACQTDGWNEKIVKYDSDHVEVFNIHDGPAKWKTNIEVSLDKSRNKHDMMYGIFPWVGLPVKQII